MQFHEGVDAPVQVTFFTDYAAATKREEALGLHDLARRIANTGADSKKQLPWLKLARFGGQRTDKNSLRHDGNVLAISGIEADYDGGAVDFDTARETLQQAGVLAIVYTSPSHTSAAPRWRVLCPLAQEYPPDRRDIFMGRLNGLFRGAFAAESWTLSQSYYFGSVNDNPAHRVEVIDGTPIDQLDELDEAWAGRPATKAANGNGATMGERRSGPIDEAALLGDLIGGKSYHHTSVRLLGRWARDGVPYLEARQRVIDAFEVTFPPDRDDRWQTRRADVDRCLNDIYGKEAKKKDDTAARQPDTASKLIVDVLPRLGRQHIPPRPWAYGTFLLFGTASALGGVDGSGKGSMAVAIALAMITGRPLLGEKVWRSGPVAIVSYEDDGDEWHRRIAAACEYHGVDYDLAISSIHFLGKSKDKICFAKMGDNGPVFPDGEALVTALLDVKPALIIVDPWNHAHALPDGNSNALIAQAAAEVNRVAHEANAAMLVLHHLRKGATGAVDDLMGATSLRATFRSTRILQRMTADEASALGVTQDPWRYSRISGSKANYAPPADQATWFQLASVALGNNDALYPDGDACGVMACWQPPAAFDDLDGNTLGKIFDQIRRGPGDAEDYRPHRQAKQNWVGHAITDCADKSDAQAAKIVTLWIENAVLTVQPYTHPRTRRAAERIVLNEAKADAILAPLRGQDAGF